MTSLSLGSFLNWFTAWTEMTGKQAAVLCLREATNNAFSDMMILIQVGPFSQIMLFYIHLRQHHIAHPIFDMQLYYSSNSIVY